MEIKIRKIWRSGDSFVISLPIEWIRSNDLGGGDHLKLEVDESIKVKTLEIGEN